jgi:type I restriction enzyme R subunit
MEEMFRRRHLPHWDYPGATYFITACLEGSIPAQGLLDIARCREDLVRGGRPVTMSEADWKARCWKLMFARADEWLDTRPAVRHLADEILATTVVDALYFFAGERYEILAYVVMPSHFHWVFRPRAEYEVTVPEGKSARELIMHSIKRDTAYKCNQRLKRQGAFWQQESFDHCVLDEDELERIIDYIELNPVKAGLAASRVKWPFSSAYDRERFGISPGHPLFRAKP